MHAYLKERMHDAIEQFDADTTGVRSVAPKIVVVGRDCGIYHHSMTDTIVPALESVGFSVEKQLLPATATIADVRKAMCTIVETTPKTNILPDGTAVSAYKTIIPKHRTPVGTIDEILAKALYHALFPEYQTKINAVYDVTDVGTVLEKLLNILQQHRPISAVTLVQTNIADHLPLRPLINRLLAEGIEEVQHVPFQRNDPDPHAEFSGTLKAIVEAYEYEKAREIEAALKTRFKVRIVTGIEELPNDPAACIFADRHWIEQTHAPIYVRPLPVADALVHASTRDEIDPALLDGFDRCVGQVIQAHNQKRLEEAA